MNKEIKVLIIAVILLFSAGPIVWFFSSPVVKELPQPPVAEEQQQGLLSVEQVNVTARIDDLTPAFSFKGVSKAEDLDAAKILLSEVAQDYNLSDDSYSVDVTLNPYGNGYEYHVAFSGFNLSQMKEIGFRTFYRMSSLFSEPAYTPLSLARVTVVFNSSDNGTVSERIIPGVAVLYSRQKNDTVRLSCKVVMAAGKIRSFQSCVDAEIRNDDPFLGLPASDLFQAQVHYKNETILPAVHVETGMLASLSSNVTEEQVRSALNWTTIKSLDVHNTSFSAVLAPLSDDQLDRLNSSLQAIPASLVRLDWKTRFMLPGEKIVLDGKEYRVMNRFFEDWVPELLPVGSNVTRNIAFSTLYNEIIQIKLAQ